MVSLSEFQNQLDEKANIASNALNKIQEIKRSQEIRFPLQYLLPQFTQKKRFFAEQEQINFLEKSLEKLSFPLSFSFIEKEFDDLKDKLKELEQELDRYKKAFFNKQSIEEIEVKIKKDTIYCQERKNQIKGFEQQLEKDQEVINREKEKLKIEKESIQSAQTKNQAGFLALKKEQETLSAQKDSWKQKKKELKEKIAIYEEEAPILEQKKIKLELDVNDLKKKTVGLEQEKFRLNDLIYDVNEKRRAIEIANKEIECGNSVLSNKKEEFEKKKQQISNQIELLLANCAQLEQQKEILEKNNFELDQEVQSLEIIHEDFKVKYNKLFQKKSTQEMLEKVYPLGEKDMDWFVKIFVSQPLEFIDSFVSVFSKKEVKRQQKQSRFIPEDSTSEFVKKDIIRFKESLPNAKKGQPYFFVLEAVNDMKKNINLRDFIFKWDQAILDEVGLFFNCEKCELRSDEILVSGDKVLKVILLKNDSSDMFYLSLPLVINPNPNELWMDISADRSDPYFKENKDIKRSNIYFASLLYASIRGRSHAHKGTCRDDDAFIDSVRDWAILLVADGVGSKPYSRKGSEIAVKTAGSYLKTELAGLFGKEADKLLKTGKKEDLQKHLVPLFQSLIPKMCETVIKKIEDEANSNKSLSSDYATTFLATLVHKDPIHKSVFIVSFWIGDGAIAIYSKKNGVYLMGQPDTGEYAGQTRVFDRKMFKDKDFWSRLQFKFYPKQEVDFIDAILMMSDGISDPYFKTDQGLTDKENWDVLWGDIEPVLNSDEDLFNWMGFFKENNHDDRTIAILKFNESSSF